MRLHSSATGLGRRLAQLESHGYLATMSSSCNREAQYCCVTRQIRTPSCWLRTALGAGRQEGWARVAPPRSLTGVPGGAATQSMYCTSHQQAQRGVRHSCMSQLPQHLTGHHAASHPRHSSPAPAFPLAPPPRGAAPICVRLACWCVMAQVSPGCANAHFKNATTWERLSLHAQAWRRRGQAQSGTADSNGQRLAIAPQSDRRPLAIEGGPALAAVAEKLLTCRRGTAHVHLPRWGPPCRACARSPPGTAAAQQEGGPCAAGARNDGRPVTSGSAGQLRRSTRSGHSRSGACLRGSCAAAGDRIPGARSFHSAAADPCACRCPPACLQACVRARHATGAA